MGQPHCEKGSLTGTSGGSALTATTGLCPARTACTARSGPSTCSQKTEEACRPRALPDSASEGHIAKPQVAPEKGVFALKRVNQGEKGFRGRDGSPVVVTHRDPKADDKRDVEGCRKAGRCHEEGERDSFQAVRHDAPPEHRSNKPREESQRGSPLAVAPCSLRTSGIIAITRE